ncbi:hypothetical protein HPB50_025120 [Hyalomma asiaticum]|uniref:Uncharacterized protein n=1 Tax=Hyalomma asiaticum TaxID=266040 RepID=A0ACB7RQL3_HYAAI|nr:hypothetical protein HPB50_025120 [Hyalomma asiaticum]
MMCQGHARGPTGGFIGSSLRAAQGSRGRSSVWCGLVGGVFCPPVDWAKWKSTSSGSATCDNAITGPEDDENRAEGKMENTELFGTTRDRQDVGPYAVEPRTELQAQASRIIGVQSCAERCTAAVRRTTQSKPQMSGVSPTCVQRDRAYRDLGLPRLRHAGCYTGRGEVTALCHIQRARCRCDTNVRGRLERAPGSEIRGNSSQQNGEGAGLTPPPGESFGEQSRTLDWSGKKEEVDGVLRTTEQRLYFSADGCVEEREISAIKGSRETSKRNYEGNVQEGSGKVVEVGGDVGTIARVLKVGTVRPRTMEQAEALSGARVRVQSIGNANTQTTQHSHADSLR